MNPEESTAKTTQFDVEELRDEAKIVGGVTDIKPGGGTQTVEDIRVSELREELTTRLRDDYPSVWLVSDGTRLCICDHEEPIQGANEPALGDQPPGVTRIEVVDAPNEARKSQYQRKHIRQALEQFDDDDRVSVHLNDNHPVLIAGEGAAVGIAPLLKPGDAP